MITNLYAKYLLADRLNKIAERAGVRIDHVKFGSYGPDVHAQVSARDRRDGESDNDAERAAERLLTAHPALRLKRTSGLVFLEGVQENGLTFEFYSGTGSCELVQVGTRVIPAVPEQVIPAQPERVEPVFEKVCPDPLRDLATA